MGEGFGRSLASGEVALATTSKAGKAEVLDTSYWTSERIAGNVSSFFDKLERNEQKLRAERERLLEKAVQEAEVRQATEKMIAQRETEELEVGRRVQFEKDLQETEAKRQFRYTLEWMVEQSHDQIRDLALNFLNGQAVK